MGTPETDITTQVSRLAGQLDHGTRSIDFARMRQAFREGKRLSSHSVSPLDLASIAFRAAGVQASEEAVTTYIDQFRPAFEEYVRGRTLQEQRDLIGRTIPRDAPIRTAFGELYEIVADFHGGALDHITRTAEYLGYYVVEHTEPIPHESGGQNWTETA